MMNILKSNRILLVALTVSLLAHAAAIFYHYNPKVELALQKLTTFELVPTSKKEVEAPSIANVENEPMVEEEAPLPKKIVKKKVAKKPAIKEAPKDIAPTNELASESEAPTINTAFIEKNYQNINLMPIKERIIDKIEYPEQARKLGLTDEGYLIIIINSEGKITSISVTDFENKIFTDAVLRAAKKLGRVPSHELASIEMRIPINFSLIEEE